MAELNIKIVNIYSPKDFTLSYKKGNVFGSYTSYPNPDDVNGVFTGGISGITITGITFDYFDQYWFKIQEYNTGRTDNPYIIENINTHSLEYFTSNCPPEPTPTATPISTPVVTPTQTATPGGSPVPTPPVTESPTPQPTLTATPGASPNPTPLETVTPTPTMTPTTTPSAEPPSYTYYVFYRMCLQTNCYMSVDTYNYYVGLYGPGYFQTGNRYYGAIENDKDYLYEFTGQTIILYTLTPECQLNGVSATTDTCD